MTEEQGGVDRGQVMLVVLITLAFIASIVMLFTDSDGALKLALLAALWAAIIGFFLVFRYRRDADNARRELALSTAAHDAELARAEAERQARLEAREERETQRSQDTAVLEDIQRELAGIRAQLENLAGREFEYEPAALRAEARRIRELENVTLEDPAEAEAEAESAVPEPEHSFGAPSPEAVAGRLGQQPSRPQANPLADLIREKQDRVEPRVFDTGSFQAVNWEQGGIGREAVVEKHEAPAAESRGRRRRDENTGGLTVAELLARARENKDA
ncbi:DUF6779 domain-containing protein [Corynebacterium sp.]|uniref:DUF6779 domain-containing protein n=1 Tax=Corynebacterium sp. TaxID=1720 RepID=UPI0026DED1FA|nr:DUF6779 domain-containing protein [Corynebacterium sp.]MDO5512053.1 hypothetical protein [Corynebacterium sp.]